MTAEERMRVGRDICARCPRRRRILGPRESIVECMDARERISLCSGRCPRRYWDARHLKKPPRTGRLPVRIFGPPEACPRDQWPLMVRQVAALAEPADRGVGDTVAGQLKLGRVNVISAVLHVFRIPCACEDRRAWLNARYPYV